MNFIIPGFLGIGEPLIYGVTPPRVKPFVTACVGGSAGGFFIGLVSYMGLPIGLNTVFGPRYCCLAINDIKLRYFCGYGNIYHWFANFISCWICNDMVLWYQKC